MQLGVSENAALKRKGALYSRPFWHILKLAGKSVLA
jgi:hypothetical protein